MPTLKIVVIAFYPKQRGESSEIESRLLNSGRAITGTAGRLGWKFVQFTRKKKKKKEKSEDF